MEATNTHYRKINPKSFNPGFENRHVRSKTDKWRSFFATCHICFGQEKLSHFTSEFVFI